MYVGIHLFKIVYSVNYYNVFAIQYTHDNKLNIVTYVQMDWLDKI